MLQQHRISCECPCQAPVSINLGAAQQLAGGIFYLQGGRDGLSAITLRDFSGGPNDLRGLRLFEQIEDIAILAIPDAVFHVPPVLTAPTTPPDQCLPTPTPAPNPVANDPTAIVTPLTAQQSVQLQAMMIDQCVRLRYRVAILDPPDGLADRAGPDLALRQRADLDADPRDSRLSIIRG